ncbi:uncharacterized protein LOC130904266 [Diorhabda carinulata]|uniref:uncharacterized protein LOC130441759 n=1 Tax=Diorhabda sublineata TaxID=1163346 RepID=UPI0024E0627D|nr:uncharacterized protein LOC130441759 [Diorhabda sublineata]XP_057672914.1 uncharacterized protein LOC130904266 [Diorhabda carinulata]
MLIAHFIRALIAVLGLAAVVIPVACNEYFNETHDVFYDFYRHKRGVNKQNRRNPHVHEVEVEPNVVEDHQHNHLNKKTHHHKNNAHLEAYHQPPNKTGECCPTVAERVEPTGGSNPQGLLVELYQDPNYKQRFYELSCHPYVLDKPCNFINKRNHNSRCVQMYSFTYALVKNTDNKTNLFPMFPLHEDGGATYTLDYIKVRSGCSCEVTVKKKRKKKNNRGGVDNS